MHTHALDHWSIPTLNLQSELSTPEETFADKPYTIFDLNHVFRSAQELSELAQLHPNATVKDIIELVSFKPERLVLHALIIFISLKIKIADDEQLQGLVFELYNKLKETDECQQLIRNAYQTRFIIEKEVSKLIEGNYTGVLERDAGLVDKFKEKIEVSAITFGRFIKDYDQQKMLLALVTDAIYKRYVGENIKAFVEKEVCQLAKTPEFALTSYATKDRQTVVVIGGQGSGKSSSMKIVKQYFQNPDLDFDNFVKLNADAYKSLLLTPGSVNKYLFSQLAQPEATFVRVQLQKLVMQDITNNSAPNLYVDQVRIGHNKLNFSLDGKVMIFIVSTKLETALQRSFLRGSAVVNDQGRFEDTTGILNGHKGTATHFFDHIFDYLNKDITVTLIDNNDLNLDPIEVMQLKLAEDQKKLVILNMEKFKLFIKKATINVNAHNDETLYASNSDEIVEDLYNDFLSKLREAGFKIKIYSHQASLKKHSIFPEAIQPSQQQVLVPVPTVKLLTYY